MRPARVARFMPQQGDRGEGHASSFGGHRGGGVGGADKGGGAPSGRPLLSTDRSFREPGIGHSAQQRVVNQPGTTSFQLAPAPVPSRFLCAHHQCLRMWLGSTMIQKPLMLLPGLQQKALSLHAFLKEHQNRCPSSSLAPPNLNEEKHNQVLLDRPLQQHLQPRWKPQQLAQLSQQVTQQPQQQQARKGAIASGQLNSVNPYVQSMPGVQMSVPFDHQPLPTGSAAVAPYRIWPPPQCHRDTMVRYLVETLVAPNLLTNNYGSPEAKGAEHCRND
ncbi:hypothetical protein U9M48_006813 [Paspalum notatum var. saurae]|uniref:Uncharacterized protein n=1 Tax=Paspalum notatum var. saurae TaxID=547442 RepID=A0AAQ3SKU1_PASNO